MALISVFFFFLFTTLGLGLIYLSQVYLKLSAFKKNSVIMEYASENGIKLGFSHVAELISQAASPTVITEPHWGELRENARAGGLRTLEEALGSNLPIEIEETGEDQTWHALIHFSRDTFSDRGGYFLADFKGTIDSEGSLINFTQKKKSGLDVSLKVAAGHVPLAYFPFLLAGVSDPGRIADLKEKQKIVFMAPAQNQIFPQMNYSADQLISPDVTALLGETLKIKILSPQNLTRAELRTALGLDMVNEPVPDGVYLVRNNTGLGGIYVQGDLDALLLAVESDFQVVSFSSKTGTWVLKYSPAQSKTQFRTPGEFYSWDRIPLSILMVNGKIDSLGAGIVEADGDVVPSPEIETPCILQGLSLTIVSADQITLTSDLIHQGVKWMNGIPYLKDSQSQLIVFANGRDFFDAVDKAGKIVISPNAPQNVKIQASLTARDAFDIPGKQKTVFITGGLQTSNLALNENILKIAPDERLLKNSLLPKNSPETSLPLLFILSLRATNWKEYE
jgi:hypothetical protein